MTPAVLGAGGGCKRRIHTVAGKKSRRPPMLLHTVKEKALPPMLLPQSTVKKWVITTTLLPQEPHDGYSPLNNSQYP
jgi:hypothetical protein